MIICFDPLHMLCYFKAINNNFIIKETVMADKSSTDEKEVKKSTGRPPGTGTKPGKLLRVLLSPRQDRLLTYLRENVGISESEAARTALDDYFEKLEARGELVDEVAVKAAAAVAEKEKK